MRSRSFMRAGSVLLSVSAMWLSACSQQATPGPAPTSTPAYVTVSPGPTTSVAFPTPTPTPSPTSTSMATPCDALVVGAPEVVDPEPSGTPVPRNIGQLILDTSGSPQRAGTIFDVTASDGTVVASTTLTSPSPLPTSGIASPRPDETPSYAALDVPELPASTVLTVQERPASGWSCGESYDASGSFTTAAS